MMEDNKQLVDLNQITSLIEQNISNSESTEKNTQTVLTEIKEQLPDVAKTSKFDFESIKALIDKSYIKTFGTISSDDEIYNSLIKDIKDLFDSVKETSSKQIESEVKPEEITTEQEQQPIDDNEELSNQIIELLDNFLDKLNNLINSDNIDLETDDGLNQFKKLYSDFLEELENNNVPLFTDDGLLNDKIFKYLSEKEFELELNITDLSKASTSKPKKKKTFRDYYNVASDRKADSISGGIAKSISRSVNTVLNVAETIKDSFNVIRHPIDTFKRVKEEGFGSLFKSKSDEELLKVGIGKNSLSSDVILKNSTYGVAIKWLYELLEKKKKKDEEKKKEEERAKELEDTGSDIANGMADIGGGMMGGFDMKTIGIIVATVAAIALGGWLLTKFFGSSKEEKENKKPENKPEKELDEEEPKPNETNTPKPQKLTQPTTNPTNEQQPNNKEIKQETPKAPPQPTNTVNNGFQNANKGIDKDTKEYAKGIENDKKKAKQQKPIKPSVIENDRKEELLEQRKELKIEEELAEALGEQSKNTIPLKALAEPSLWDKFTDWIGGIGEGIKNGIQNVGSWFSGFTKGGPSVNLGSYNGLGKKGVKVNGITEGVITSEFGVDRGNHKHGGIDIAGALNTRVNSGAAGKVVYSGFNKGGYGNLVIIEEDLGNGKVRHHYSAHLNNIDKNIKVGSMVEKGQFLGGMGNTGRHFGKNGGIHLHSEVRENAIKGRAFSGRQIDPSAWFGIRKENDKPKDTTPKPSEPEQKEKRPITKEVANKNKKDTEKKKKSEENFSTLFGKNIADVVNKQENQTKPDTKKIKNEEHENKITAAVSGGDDFTQWHITTHLATEG